MNFAQDTEATSEPVRRLPELTIIDTSNRAETTDITPGVSAAPTPDAMDLLTRMPGANVNRNGPLSGQAQYRGLFGPRLTVLVDSMRVTPGGLNWMDAPMHYMPPGLTRKVTMTRGIAPVSTGPAIGGLVEAESKKSEFTADSEFVSMGEVVASIISNDGSAFSALAGLANANHRVHAIGSVEDGDNTEFNGGTIAATEHERTTYGLGYGYQQSYNSLSLDYSHTDTGLTGTPALPLDIDFFDTDRINVGIRTRWNRFDLSAQVFYTDIGHGMNNFTLRSPTDISMLPLPAFEDEERRTTDVEANALGFAFQADLAFAGGELGIGFDGNLEEHSGIVIDPDAPAFFVQNFSAAQQDNIGIFAEWVGELSSRLTLEAGLRYDRTRSDAGNIDAQPAQLCDSGLFGPGTPPCAVAALRDRFNSTDRSIDDDTLDAVLKLDYEASDDLLIGIGYARKTRPPSYIERFLWIPLEVNSGLGDLNNYVGNAALDPEVSDQVELALDWSFRRGYFSPRLFYRQVNDYIQGVASSDPTVISVSGNANGDSTPLVFTNVDAELYGLDAQFRYQFTKKLRLDATVSFVRGKRTDIDDNLYRIAPLNGRAGLTYEQDNWLVTIENVQFAKQDKISRAIVLNEVRSSNASTPGYGIVNLYVQLLSRQAFQVRVGVENLFDENYTSHLVGFNQVANSDVAVGQRLPGPGINIFTQFSYAWR